MSDQARVLKINYR